VCGNVRCVIWGGCVLCVLHLCVGVVCVECVCLWSVGVCPWQCSMCECVPV